MDLSLTSTIKSLQEPLDTLNLEPKVNKRITEKVPVNPLRGPEVIFKPVAAVQQNGTPSGYEYDAPTGTYGAAASPPPSEQGDRIDQVKAEAKQSTEPNYLPVFPSSLISTDDIVFIDRKSLLSFRKSPLVIDVWAEKYKTHIEAAFPEICRRPDVKYDESYLYSMEGVEDADSDSDDEIMEQDELSLRPYQEQLVERSLRGENDIILLPTGSGKTFVAIRLILDHIEERLGNGKVKVIFFAPTVDLVCQQLKTIRKHMPPERKIQCRAITGKDNLSAEQVKDIIKDGIHLVVAVTPAIIENYFLTSRDASLSDFSLLIFDEMHHAKKKHNYNVIMHRCLSALDDDHVTVPQLVGMTATIGIGTATSLVDAKDYILKMCAKFNLSVSPWRQQLYLDQRRVISEELVLVDNVRNRVSDFIQRQFMSTLEELIADKLDADRLKKVLDSDDDSLELGLDFHDDRLSPVYEQHIVSLRKAITKLPYHAQLEKNTRFSKLALKYLRKFYVALQLINLLTGHYGVLYLQELKQTPGYDGVADIWELFTGNFDSLREVQEKEDKKRLNPKIDKLIQRLKLQFEKKPDSKVIIFVQRRRVAQYLAEYLNNIDQFKASEFTSVGQTPEEPGMKPQQRLDIRAKFEGNKYNILVSTSVLEEGIDIKACNMVVRYMYVKDMIGKIQSRGRVRQGDGVLISLLDEKLLGQERDNQVKVNLMFEALSQINDMSTDEFQDEVRKKQPGLIAELSANATSDDHRLQDVGADVEICCEACSSFLGYLQDVRVFQNTHHLVIDGGVHTRVRFVPRKTPFRDGIEKVGKVLCINKGEDDKVCNALVGVVVKMGCGYNFVMWRAKEGIQLRVGRKQIRVSQWKDIRDVYRLPSITIEELKELGATHQFVYTPRTRQLFTL